MIIRQMRIEDVAGIARVHARTWQTTYRGIIPDDYWTDLTPLLQEGHA